MTSILYTDKGEIITKTSRDNRMYSTTLNYELGVQMFLSDSSIQLVRTMEKVLEVTGIQELDYNLIVRDTNIGVGFINHQLRKYNIQGATAISVNNEIQLVISRY